MKHLSTLMFFLMFLQGSWAQSPIYDPSTIHHPVVGKNGMVASQHHEATRVGVEILKQGGNAIDAAVAVGFCLAVVLPRAGNLGGGGFMLIYDAEADTTVAINYREMAPGASYQDMYLDSKGEVDDDKFNMSYHSVGVPGTVAGMVLALEKYGTMSLSQVLQPAIKLAEEGFSLSYEQANVLKGYESRLRKWPETEKIFYKGKGQYFQHGDFLRQSDLAWSLRQIAENGADAFYKGEIADKICKDMLAHGGIITKEDFANYKTYETAPVSGNYRGYKIVSMPPPSSGGLHVIQMLNMLESFPLRYFEHNSAEAIHILTEVMKRAYADRSEHLGDPMFWEVPVNGLLSQNYAESLSRSIKRHQATPSDVIKPGMPQAYESEETTHYSVADKYGNVVSNTYTLNFSFGTGIVAKGTGILLNNEMGDFSAKPGTPNAFGLLGGQANAVEPQKRPLSSMTPTIVFKDEKPFIVTGSPGGSRIITTVLQIILNIIDYDMNVAEATHAPRIHHQWYPDYLYYEKGISTDTRLLLAMRGHNLQLKEVMGSTQTIMLDDSHFLGASDPRRPDAATMGIK